MSMKKYGLAKVLIIISALLYGELKPWTLAGFIAGILMAASIELYVWWRIKEAKTLWHNQT